MGWGLILGCPGTGMLGTLEDRGYGHPPAVTASVSKGQQGTHSEKGAEPAAGSGPDQLLPALRPRNPPDGLSCPTLKAPRVNLSAKPGVQGAEPRRGVRGSTWCWGHGCDGTQTLDGDRGCGAPLGARGRSWRADPSQSIITKPGQQRQPRSNCICSTSLNFKK